MKYEEFNANEARKLSVKELLSCNALRIPEYQRPYKWTIKNVDELLRDIQIAIEDDKKYTNTNFQFKYRIGTIILHKNKDEKILDIVDGQQRIITLLLLMKVLNNDFNSNLLTNPFDNTTTISNIFENYNYIKSFDLIKNNKKPFSNAIDKILEVVVITVENIGEAFQLFDSQNSRGKGLYPHDLLKAYHLRVLKENKNECYRIINKWENTNPKSIDNLFRNYLFPIYNWTKKESTINFTANCIDIYKGIEETSPYTYAKRTRNINPYFLINEPFIEGKDFFNMVEHYLNLLEDINKDIEESDEEIFKRIRTIIKKTKNYVGDKYKDTKIEYIVNNCSKGFKYVFNLFKCVLLFYYDKFKNYDYSAVKNLFIWAMSMRIGLKSLPMASINKNAIDDANIAMFYEINKARTHYEIARLKNSLDSKEATGSNNIKEEQEKLLEQLKTL